MALILERVTKNENLGEHAGGSGHLSHTSLHDLKVVSQKNTSLGLEVEYSYTLVVTTEFTIEPDNPPYEYHRKAKIIIGNNGEVVEE